MSKHTPPLYALTPITETEGLEETYYRCIKHPFEAAVFALFKDGEWLCNNHDPSVFTHYLRPLPEGTVAVSPANLEDFIEWLADNYEREHKEIRSNLWFKNEDGLEYTTKEVVAQFITNKLAQMGE